MSRFKHIDPAGTAPPATESLAASEQDYDAEHYLELGEEALADGRFEVALRHYSRTLEHDRLNLNGWLGQARALVAMQQPNEAFTWLEQAAKVAGDHPAFFALRAITCARTHQAEDALAWSDRAMRDGADRADVWLARAEVLYQQREHKTGALALDKAYERERTGETALRCAESALEWGEQGSAKLWLDRADRALPESALVALRRGVYLERIGDWAGARAALERALALRASCVAAELALSELSGRSTFSHWNARILRWFRGT
jgi:tetratricopeptide (TPR) repeat protein